MKKTALALIAALVVTTNIAFAQVKTLNSATIQNVFPHTVSKDAGLIIEGKLTATDYASLLLAFTNVQNNNETIRKKVSNTYLGQMAVNETLFVKENGAVFSSYDYDNKQFTLNEKVDIVSLAQFSISYLNAVQNTDKFNDTAKYKSMIIDTVKYQKLINDNNTAMKKLNKTSTKYKQLQSTNTKYEKMIKDSNTYKKLMNDAATYQNTAKSTATKNALATSRYVLNNMYKEGKFFEDSNMQKVDYKTMGNGMLSLYTLWQLTHKTDKENLGNTAKEIYDFINSSWKAEYNVFALSGNAESVKFDLRDFGLFLWGSKELSQILAQTGHGYEAATLMMNTSKMIDKVLVKDTTYRAEGIVREIEVKAGVVSAPKDEINIGRLHTFLYGFTRWNESAFSKLMGTENKNISFVKDMVMYSVKNHVDEYATIHDTKFTDVSVKESSKETPYLTWFMITSDYMIERYKGYFTSSELKQVESAIQKNYNFLIEKMLVAGKKM